MEKRIHAVISFWEEFSLGVTYLMLPVSFYTALETMRKPLVFCCFQGLQIGASDIEWINHSEFQTIF